MKKHILVIDDDFANRKLPGLFLRDLEHEVTDCSSAEEAFALVKEHRFTDVLLDISLPQVSGLEIFKILREQQSTKHLRIVAYTAHAMPEEVREFIELGFDGILIKPICRDDLLRIF
jgi:CheY-like chemotaxis protein